MCDYTSPYYDMYNKHEEVSKAFIGKENYNPPQRVLDCIDIYAKMQYSAERRALDSAVRLSDSITNLSKQSDSDSKQMENLIRDLDKEINSAADVFDKMSLMKEKLEIKKQAIDLAEKSSKVVTNLEKTIESIGKLRVSVVQAMYQDADNNKSINNFLIDELLD
jgi:hypothetical protein